MRRGFHFGGSRCAAADFRIFSEDALKAMHLGTLEVLERTGVWVEQDEALDIYADGGCDVDRDTHIVRFPPGLVEAAIAAVPPTWTLYCGRKPENDVVLNTSTVTFTNFSTGLMVNDLETGERRPAIRTDIGDLARIVDACDNIDFVRPPLAASDVPPELQYPVGYARCVANSTKAVMCSFENTFEQEIIYRIAAAVAGGEDALAKRPSVHAFTVAVAPMRLPRHATETTIWSARKGLNGWCSSMVMAGATGPASIAGGLVSQNADHLAVLVLQHLIQPGLPFLYGTSGTVMDMRWGTCVQGSPEAALVSTGTAAMAHYYNMPSKTGGL
jgi:trimethylamine--corrinoid protein Co-methyltransferase